MGPPRHHGKLLLALLLFATVHATNGTPPRKACDFQDPLCSLQARFMFGSFAIGDQVYYSGGLDANEPTYPLSGSYLEAFDTKALRPYILQTIPNAALNTSRYCQQIVPWGDNTVIMVGGQFDNTKGASEKATTMVTLDLVNRMWKLRREFWQSNQAELVWNWAGVDGDMLYMIVEDFGGTDPATGKNRDLEDMGRNLYAFNLSEPQKGKDMLGSFPVLGGGLFFMQLPVVTAGPLAPGGPVFVWQSARYVASEEAMAYPVQGLPAMLPMIVLVGGEGLMIPGALALLKTAFKKLPSSGATGGKILKALFSPSRQQLLLWSKSGASFEGHNARVSVQALSQYDVEIVVPRKEEEPAWVQLTLTRAFVAVPPRLALGLLSSIDLPVAGEVAISSADAAAGRVVQMPYVGEVDIVSDLDTSIVDILETPSGFVVRGNSLPGATCATSSAASTRWEPFIVVFDLSAGGGRPVIRGLGANTWCPTAEQQGLLGALSASDSRVKGFRGVHGVESANGGKQLLQISPQILNTLDIFPDYDPIEPLQGAIINLEGNTMHAFQAKPDPKYRYPRYVAACVTRLPTSGGGGHEVYLEYGGAAMQGTPKIPVLSDVSVMIVPHGRMKASAAIGVVSGSGQLPHRAHAAIACGPDGRAWVFGGLRDTGTESETQWQPTHDLSSISIVGGKGGTALSMKGGPLGRAAGAIWPPARYGAAMVFLPPGLNGHAQGSLLLFGGSNGTDPELTSDYVKSLKRPPLLGDAWLYDIACGAWSPLLAPGEGPPPMMWHAMALDGSSVSLHGGLTFGPAARRFERDTNLYALDLAEALGPPAWRLAPVDAAGGWGSAELGEYPKASLVPLAGGGGGAVALQCGRWLCITPKTVTLHLKGDNSAIGRKWLKSARQLSSGDRVILDPDSPTLELHSPLVVSSTIVITGASRKGTTGGAEDGGRVEIACAGNTSTALVIMSAGATLQNVAVRGCNRSAIHLLPDYSDALETGKYPDGSPIKLVNVTLANNPGSALCLDSGTAATMLQSRLERNGATTGAIVAAAGTMLRIADCRLSRNNGSAVAFSGVEFAAARCAFIDNRALDGAGVRGAFVAPPAQLYAASDAGMQVPSVGYMSITNCSFAGNAADERGGGLFVGEGMSARVENTVFSNNKANEGGGAHADRGGCLERLDNATFVGNTARLHGGGLLSRAPLRGEGAMQWRGVAVTANSAGGDGGGAYVSELLSRALSISACSFDHNQANGTEASGAPGWGGGVWLGSWSSEVIMEGVNITRNRAALGGGGMHAMLLSGGAAGGLQMVNCTVTHNTVGTQFLAKGEGGGLQVRGSFAGFSVTGASMACNRAGQGGAISFAVEYGAARISRSAFDGNTATSGNGGAIALSGIEGVFDLTGVAATGNTAFRSGGAVSCSAKGARLAASGGRFSSNTANLTGGGVMAGAGVDASVAGSSFEGNAAAGDGTDAEAAGGGVSCERCDALTLLGSTFVNNSARSFGGGVAVLRPAGDVIVDGCGFDLNRAAAGAPEQASRRLLRRLQQQKRQGTELEAEEGAGDGDGSGGYSGGGDSGMSRTLRDEALYRGGGGIYVSSEHLVTLNNNSLSRNTGASGGGAIVRTDVCSDTSGESCMLHINGISVQGNSAPNGTGGGLLITDMSRARAQCEATGNSSGGANANATAILSQCLLVWAKGDGSGGGGMVFAGNTAAGGYGRDVAGAASGLRVARVTSIGTAVARPGSLKLLSASAPPGGVLEVDVNLTDWTGGNVQSGVDANMVLQVGVRRAEAGSLLPDDSIVRAGNISRASRGVASFRSLQVFAPPGDYVIEFSPMDPKQRALLKHAELNLQLRNCTVGEALEMAGAADAQLEEAGVSFKCTRCGLGTVSLDQHARGGCIKCERADRATCYGHAKVPESGYWHSHPRSPLVHQCMIPAACSHDSDWLQQWAANHATMTACELNKSDGSGRPLYLKYVEKQCAEGYQGVLCGECSEGYGRRGHVCAKCKSRPVNSFLYFLATAWMVILVSLIGFFHVRQVHNRRRQRDRSAAAAAKLPGSASRVDSARAASTIAAMLLDSQGSAVTGVKEQLPGQVQEQLRQPDWDPRVDFAAGPRDQDQATCTAPRTAGPSGDSSGLFSTASVEAIQDATDPIFKSQPLLQGASRHVDDDVAAGPDGNRDAKDQAAFGAAGQQGSQAAAGSVRFWLSDVLKLLITHLQLLGLMRGLKLDWAPRFSQALGFFDQTQSISSWVIMECSFATGSGMRPSVKRTLVLLMMPVMGVLAGFLYWVGHALVSWCRAPHRAEWCRSLRMGRWRSYYLPRLELTAGLVLFFVYPQVSSVVISVLIACTPGDQPSKVDEAYLPPTPPGSTYPAGATPSALSSLMAQGSWWSYDTHFQCWSGDMRYVFVVAVVWAVAFCAGFPIVMSLLLARFRRRLDDPEVDLRYGFFYDSYRRSLYFWEAVLLSEKLAVAAVVTGLQQYGAAPQALAVSCVVFAALVLQIRYRPYGCRMLDSLQRGSLYVLTGTCLALMAASLREIYSEGLMWAALAVCGVLNALLVALFVYAMVSEARRMAVAVLDSDGDGRVSWWEVKRFMLAKAPRAALGCLGGCGVTRDEAAGAAARGKLPGSGSIEAPKEVEEPREPV